MSDERRDWSSVVRTRERRHVAHRRCTQALRACAGLLGELAIGDRRVEEAIDGVLLGVSRHVPSVLHLRVVLVFVGALGEERTTDGDVRT